MITEKLYAPFELVYKTLKECPKSNHTHLFFELVYIKQGVGVQLIENKKFNYQKGSIFLIQPNISHEFLIEEETSFLFIRFTHIYIKGNGFSNKQIKMLEYILQHTILDENKQLEVSFEEELLHQLLNATVPLIEKYDTLSELLKQQYVNTIITLITKNLIEQKPFIFEEKVDDKLVEIINYIHTNIYSPQKITTSILSEEFNMSKTYFGKYFKTHFKETLQDYIIKLRIKLIKSRLMLGNERVSDIAFSFGFTDSSHLNSFFKKHCGVSPKTYRKLPINLKEENL